MLTMESFVQVPIWGEIIYMLITYVILRAVIYVINNFDDIFA